MAGNQFMIRWNEHLVNFADAFLMLRDETEYVDCSLACEDGIVDAHRLVLAGCSSYLRQLFARAANPHPIIFLTNTRKSVVLLLIEFIYRGQAYVPEEKLADLISLGKSLKIKGLNKVLDSRSQFCPNVSSSPQNNLVCNNGLTKDSDDIFSSNDLQNENLENEEVLSPTEQQIVCENDVQANLSLSSSTPLSSSSPVPGGLICRNKYDTNMETSNEDTFINGNITTNPIQKRKRKLKSKQTRKKSSKLCDETENGNVTTPCKSNLDDSKNLSLLYRMSRLEIHMLGAYCKLHGMEKAKKFAKKKHQREVRAKTIEKYKNLYLGLSTFRKKKVDEAMQSVNTDLTNNN